MRRRTWLKSSAAALWSPALLSALEQERLEEAAAILQQATASGLVEAATLCVRQGSFEFSRACGAARSVADPFLLGSITKPICITALMTLFDQGKFGLDDPVQKHLPEFTGQGREQATIRHLLTHTCGLPDQLPENHALRARHATLAEFTAAAVRTPLLFPPGTKYSYSSMGILLAAEIAQRLSGRSIHELTDDLVFQKLGMKHSALGLGRFTLADVRLSQTEHAAPEAGAGDPAAKDWDWNSPYWRKLGAPWGGAHCSAPDVARWLAEFLYAPGKIVQRETALLMRKNHNSAGMPPRGLGFALGTALGGPQVSEETFGHTGSTGTIAWADPATETICVVLTSLPAQAVQPHPRQLAAERVAAAAR
jgi:CubicO group peptidase (beta-lactamase class C family)